MTQTKRYIINYSDLITYLDATIDQWPWGHIIPTRKDNPKERYRLLANASGIMASAYIQRFSDASGDATLYDVCVTALGYDPLKLDAVQWSDIYDHLDTMFVFFDNLLGELLPLVTTNQFLVTLSGEDLILDDQGNRFRVKYLALLEEVQGLRPPKRAKELDDLDETAEYINKTVATILEGVEDPAILEEIKRLAIEAINRH